MRKGLLVLFAVAALAAPAVAAADSCANFSRSAPACNLSCTAPVIQGNWVWLPSIDPSAPAGWGFASPGGADSTAFGFPGANGDRAGDGAPCLARRRGGRGRRRGAERGVGGRAGGETGRRPRAASKGS